MSQILVNRASALKIITSKLHAPPKRNKSTNRWCEKTAIVTGAEAGLGAAITKRLLEAKVNVIGLDLETDRLQKLAEQSNCNKGGTLCPMKCDVRKDEEVEEAFKVADCTFGGTNILVNNAGVIDYRPIIESSTKDCRAVLERIMDINVVAMSSCVAKAIRSMRKNNITEGHIFNVNSIVGHYLPTGLFSENEGYNGWSLYPASKFAAVAMSQTVRQELSRCKAPVRVTSICPGFVKTELLKHSDLLKDFFDKIETLDPEDVADAVMYALATRPECQISELIIQRRGEII